MTVIANETTGARFDHDAVRLAAQWMGSTMAAADVEVARAVIEPGDATRYEITIIRDHVSCLPAHDRIRSEWLVVVNDCAYAWRPESGHVDPIYAASKWTRNREGIHTGTVLSVFLNELVQTLRGVGVVS